MKKPQAAFLSRISIRQHAAIVGLLVERHVLITSNAIYVVNGKSPPADRILFMDSGLLWIALAERLRGDIITAEDALREAIWKYIKVCGQEGTVGTADINLATAEAMIERWQKKSNDWFIDIVAAGLGYMHPDASITPDNIGSIWGDAWRLYAGALSVLGDATSRRVPGDSDDYFS